MAQFETKEITDPKMLIYADPQTGIHKHLATRLTMAELEKRFWAHLYVNHFEFILELEEAGIFNRYMLDVMQSVSSLFERLQSENKPDYIVEELCLDALLEEVRPARSPYFLHVLSGQFPEIYQSWQRQGILKVQIINFTRYLRGQSILDTLFENLSREKIYENVSGQFIDFFRTQRHLLGQVAFAQDEN